MSLTPFHDWSLAPREAIALQRRRAGRVQHSDRIDPVRHLAGVDIGFEQGGEITRAVVVVLAWPLITDDPAGGSAGVPARVLRGLLVSQHQQ